MMLILNSVDSLLEHIKDVQHNVIEFSSDSLLKMSDYIEKNNLEVDDNLLSALQYQDIITQQLNATNDTIDSMRSNLNIFIHAYEQDENIVKDSMIKLQDKLNITLQEAKDKQNRFSGKTAQNDEQNEEIEFF